LKICFFSCQVEYWRNKDAGVIAKELTRLAAENALKGSGIAWRIGNPCAYEEDIKVRRSGLIFP
jgi:hypothetical protein